MAMVRRMSDERKPSEDLKEGLGLIFRAARTAAKRVDVASIDKGLDKAVTQVTRVVSSVGRVVSDELNRMAASPPAWARGKAKPQEPPKEDEGEGPVQASADQGQGQPSDSEPGSGNGQS